MRPDPKPTKGLGIAGAFFLLACERADSSLHHDTYFVVSHAWYTLSLLAIAVIVAAIWMLISRIAPKRLRKLLVFTLTIFATGAACLMAPSLVAVTFDPANIDVGRFVLANRLALIGTIFLSIALVITLVALAWAAISFFTRRT